MTDNIDLSSYALEFRRRKLEDKIDQMNRGVAQVQRNLTRFFADPESLRNLSIAQLSSAGNEPAPAAASSGATRSRK